MFAERLGSAPSQQVVWVEQVMVPLGPVIGLMVVMAAKHFCADFLLQTAWIAKGKAAAHGWVTPLLIHAGGHALFTLLIALVLFPRLWWIAPLEWVVHAGIDRLKVIVGREAKLDMGHAEFWWLLGFDQFLHQLTNIVIVFAFLAYGTASA